MSNMCSPEDELLERGLRMIEQGIELVRRYGCGERGPEVLTGALRDVFQQGNRLEAARTALIGELDQIEQARPDGERERSVPGWLRWEMHLTDSAAYGQVRLARQLGGLPSVASAFARGEVSQHHAATIARTVDQVERWGGNASAVREAEVLMLEEARHRDPDDLLNWGKDLRHRLDPEDLAAEERDRHQRRYLSLRRRRDGMTKGEFLLDEEGAATLRTAMDSVLGPRRKDDERTPAQRRADGLVGVARRLLDSGRLPSRGGEKPHLTVLASVETLLGEPGAPAALLDWLYPISRPKLLQICEDATATPVLLQEGNPLWVGRARRTAGKRMRRALAVRDRGCRTPGCDRPPGWTQAHHERGWSQGGRTDLPNLTSYCSRDHGLADAGYRTVRLPDGRLARVRPVDEHFGPAVHDPGSRGP
jgi:hypothetical protein